MTIIIVIVDLDQEHTHEVDQGVIHEVSTILSVDHQHRADEIKML